MKCPQCQYDNRKGRASAKSASRAFNAISDLAGMPLERPRGLDIRRASKNEEAHATWRA
jgi:hypothetical protein